VSKQPWPKIRQNRVRHEAHHNNEGQGGESQQGPHWTERVIIPL
jgi:hypothetical protein